MRMLIPGYVENSSPTPILDRVFPIPPAPPASERHRQVVTTCAWILIAVLAACCAATIFPSVGQRLIDRDLPFNKWFDETIARIFDPRRGVLLIWPFVAPFVALFAITAVHELGHVVVGLCTGFRLLGIQIGSLAISSFRIRRKHNLYPGARGLALMTPTQTHNLRQRALAMYLGGPLASLVSALALLWWSPWDEGVPDVVEG